ncbi:hypothetical protein GUJ93_ZPchr0006g45361 [Zizania palustris]|uniref:Uncharacterized protein n=1 Tax=Zizania palustris TaxID=103762 RepID=A0A8J5SL22_ZIZPA|nr:hypothetical protein GUJ93_ZPchr0006g45361 [Zizania palustris]
MLSGRAVTLHQRSDSGEHLVEDVASEEAGDEEEAEAAAKVLYQASFQELMPNYLQYDTIIWAVISLVLVLAWGIGLLMLLYLPYKRFVLKKDILSRKLYVTENRIMYKASRPSYLPFMGIVKKEIKVPLHLVVDVIVEQAAMNGLVRTSAIMSNGPFILNLDCDHYVHNSAALREGMCFMLDRGGDRVCFVQFPQLFKGISTPTTATPTTTSSSSTPPRATEHHGWLGRKKIKLFLTKKKPSMGKKTDRTDRPLEFLTLLLPPSGAFNALTELKLEQIRFDGQFILGDSMFPSLQRLLIDNTLGLVDLALNSSSLVWLKLSHFRGLQRINVEAHSLELLCVVHCLRYNVQVARFSMEGLKVLRWRDRLDPILVNSIEFASFSPPRATEHHGWLGRKKIKLFLTKKKPSMGKKTDGTEREDTEMLLSPIEDDDGRQLGGDIESSGLLPKRFVASILVAEYQGWLLQDTPGVHHGRPAGALAVPGSRSTLPPSPRPSQ